MRGKGSKEFSRNLRRHQTDAEKKLWLELRSRRLNGAKFRRQQPLGPYFADFCSLEKMLIIELDGGQHATAVEKDKERTKYLQEMGFKVIRFWDHEVLKNIEGVLEVVEKSLGKAPSPRPSPLEGEGDKKLGKR
jgi:very-short-patch-repair endonuclease